MDGRHIGAFGLAKSINRIAQDIEEPTQGALPNWHFDGRLQVARLCAPLQSISRGHRYTPDYLITQMLSRLDDQAHWFAFDLVFKCQRVI